MASPEGEILLLNYFGVSDIWPDKKDGLWLEAPYKRWAGGGTAVFVEKIYEFLPHNCLVSNGICNFGLSADVFFVF